MIAYEVGETIVVNFQQENVLVKIFNILPSNFLTKKKFSYAKRLLQNLFYGVRKMWRFYSSYVSESIQET